MKKKNYMSSVASLLMLAVFVLWTLAVRFIDVKAIGPDGTSVGFAAVNAFVHELTGVNMFLYHITDWLSLVPIVVAVGFALLGIIQWVKRKKLNKVDRSLSILGGFYVVVIAVYILFEFVTVNYRPVLIGGRTEASYPSSTTLLVMCVMPTAIMQFNSRMRNASLKKSVSVLIIIFIIFMVAGRILSGVHWVTDIVGAALFSSGLVMLYRYLQR